MSFSEHLRIDPNFFEHRKTRRAIRQGGFVAVSILLKLWTIAAKEAPLNGVLKDFSVEDLAFDVELDLQVVKDAVDSLSDNGFIILEEKTLKIHEWETHQTYFSEKQKRSQRARENVQKRWNKGADGIQTEYGSYTTGVAPEYNLNTTCNTLNKSNINKYNIKETKDNTNSNGVFISQNIQNLLFKAFGTTHNGRTEDWLSIHGEDHVSDALKITIDKKAKSPNYTQSILDSWLKEGYPEDKEKQEADDYNEYVKMIAERDSDD